MAEKQRIEIRGGVKYEVTVLPEAKRKKQSDRKVGGGKRYSRQAALATTPVRFCPKCKRDRAVTSFDRATQDVPRDGTLCFDCRKARSLKKERKERAKAGRTGRPLPPGA
jgi:hypothetical protein